MKPIDCVDGSEALTVKPIRALCRSGAAERAVMKILVVAGARPNFVKVAPLIRAMRGYPTITPILVNTGQHYSWSMSEQFINELGIPEPDLNLGVGSGSHAVQTAEAMKRLEPVLEERCQDLVLVVGDVNSTLAAALTVVKMGIPVAHVEAGLRSFDRSMPEEINQVLTDAISDILPTVTCVIAARNEEQTIGAKLENLLASHYPSDRLDIIVVSDGSIDQTCAVVEQWNNKSNSDAPTFAKSSHAPPLVKGGAGGFAEGSMATKVAQMTKGELRKMIATTIFVPLSHLRGKGRVEGFSGQCL
jgi:UDP-N-acetylglucosamine 2-epimerase